MTIRDWLNKLLYGSNKIKGDTDLKRKCWPKKYDRKIIP